MTLSSSPSSFQLSTVAMTLPSSSSLSTQSPTAVMKDYSSALAALQSRYGASGGIPTLMAKSQEAPRTKARRSSVSDILPTLSYSPSPSPPSSIQSAAVSTKDYASALASMHSRYGTSGSLPPKSRYQKAPRSKSPGQSSMADTSSSVSHRSSSSGRSTPAQSSTAPAKDYSSAFASLQSRYGASGSLPMPKPTKSDPDTSAHVPSPSRSNPISSRFKVLLRKVTSALLEPEDANEESPVNPSLFLEMPMHRFRV